ncbi:MAG: DUF952 domain-containing protein [Chloroflexi bacterium HGW-Chloroflexi-8]|jgi:uncharacterized protein (DUF952 family)|nr:MAG: DUF952 domain-containing protein [Chloroflexi bacterium HGW-Chloroflexi-8]
MKFIAEKVYHIISQNLWEDIEKLEYYYPDSLQNEGFIHLSNATQVSSVVKRFYANLENLVVLEINTNKLKSPIKYESVGTDGIFPHLYGKLNVNAVENVFPILKNENGDVIWNE